MMYQVKIIKQTNKEELVDLKKEFPKAPESDLKAIVHGCPLSDDKKQCKRYDKIIWTYRRLYQLASNMGVESGLSLDVLIEYHTQTEQSIIEKPSNRAYRAYFKSLVKHISPDHNAQFDVSVRKGRSDRGKTKYSLNVMRSKGYSPSHVNVVDLDVFHDFKGNLEKTAEVLSAPEHTRKKTALADDALKMMPSNVVDFNPLILHLKNGNNVPVEVNLEEFLTYDFCDNNLLVRIAGSFRLSNISPSSKLTYLNHLNQIFYFKQKTENKNEPISDRLFKAYLYDLHDKVRRGVIKNKATTVSQKQRWTNAILPLFGLKRLTRADLIKVKSGGNELASDAYTDKEWKMIVRALITDRKRLIGLINQSGSIHGNIITDYMANILMMTTVYTAATQAEMFTATFPDQVVSYSRNGKDHWITEGIKNRAASIRNTELKFKQNGKRMFEEFLPISKKVNALGNNTDYQLFISLDYGETRELNSTDLHSYANNLFQRNSELKEYKIDNPKFSINTQRIRSSITSKVASERGDASSIVSGRHKISVHRTAKYGRNNKQVNQKELAAQTHVMEHFGRNSGNVKLAIKTVESEFSIQVLTPLAAKRMREKNLNFNDIANGGTCQNKDTKHKKKFLRTLDNNPLLTDDDKKLMGCGYIINCFSCENFAVVDEVVDIWRLLSFEQKVKDIFTQHQNLDHYIKNYADLIERIDELKSKFTPQKLKVATKRMGKTLHPFWADEYAIFDVLRDFGDAN
ncbi:hypothetical protein CWO07_24910 [Vibrio splendidus]|uniref:Uncharacterized protein n=1 Tax=Vibrio splendidus TaxID=29497 RepID=A0A2T5EGR0_VIBSP|nr:hypothetical protein [Vibrio splendidus]PTP18761.1 hypothetical protein CWO07_24910 [Vibrio splendidus]